MSENQKPIVIMGATATGKTELSLKIARKVKGEIISSDSRQVYKSLNAGLAKPNGKWNKENTLYVVDGINYHLTDILNPNLTYDASVFCKQTKKIIKEITARGNVAILAGGTGLYIQSYFVGMDKLPKANEKIRTKLTEEIKKKGNAALHKKLQKIDPVSAEKIPAQNTQRLIRALEIYKLTGRPISSFHTKKYDKLPSDKALFVLLKWDKKLLHKRIEQRTHKIFPDMITETNKLLASGYKPDCPALKSLGYREVLDFVRGKLTKTQAIEKIIGLTKAYAKRQTTWFKRYKNVFLVNVDIPEEWNTDALAEKIIQKWKK
ncbi:MAG TPA: tRNA (adenosine(37)-N6)-dimethylallyltransferase MiaA [Elusimicrobiales bacterium]|nr:tRNA (adenosine(37)-N6)-dimethylallyltransferase MiaA [Elusimicrobiales bacterium]